MVRDIFTDRSSRAVAMQVDFGCALSYALQWLGTPDMKLKADSLDFGRLQRERRVCMATDRIRKVGMLRSATVRNGL